MKNPPPLDIKSNRLCRKIAQSKAKGDMRVIESIWRLAWMQRGVPLRAFNEDWKPLIEYARSFG